MAIVSRIGSVAKGAIDGKVSVYVEFYDNTDPQNLSISAPGVTPVVAPGNPLALKTYVATPSPTAIAVLQNLILADLAALKAAVAGAVSFNAAVQVGFIVG